MMRQAVGRVFSMGLKGIIDDALRFPDDFKPAVHSGPVQDDSKLTDRQRRIKEAQARAMQRIGEQQQQAKAALVVRERTAYMGTGIRRGMVVENLNALMHIVDNMVDEHDNRLEFIRDVIAPLLRDPVGFWLVGAQYGESLRFCQAEYNQALNFVIKSLIVSNIMYWYRGLDEGRRAEIDGQIQLGTWLRREREILLRMLPGKNAEWDNIPVMALGRMQRYRWNRIAVGVGSFFALMTFNVLSRTLAKEYLSPSWTRTGVHFLCSVALVYTMIKVVSPAMKDWEETREELVDFVQILGGETGEGEQLNIERMLADGLNQELPGAKVDAVCIL